jgi:hypothetical protein
MVYFLIERVLTGLEYILLVITLCGIKKAS